MINKELTELFEDCLTYWGEEKQLRMVQEECAELILAVSHYLRGRPDAKENLLEELGDVWLMVSQMIHHYGEGDVEKVVDFKSNRTAEKLIRYKDKEN